MTVKQAAPPEGFRYQPEVVSPDEELELVADIQALPLRAFEFHGYTGKRRVYSYGWHYDFETATLKQAEPIPAFLLGARERAAGFAGLRPDDLPHALVTEYTPGTPIGWHKDKAAFGDVIGGSAMR
jgi:alkylated DNA repair dioxygenase AlkB